VILGLNPLRASLRIHPIKKVAVQVSGIFGNLNKVQAKPLKNTFIKKQKIHKKKNSKI
jgi:hypothetical protein